MKNINNTFVQFALITHLILILFGGLPAQTENMKQPDWDFREHQAEIIDYAKKYSVSNIQPGLPRKNFASWFQQIVGAKRKVNWRLADCGMQNRVPMDGKRLEAMMCVETLAWITRKIYLHV